MSYQTGTATDYSDLLTKLDAFLTKGHSLEPAYTGTGNGTITNLIGTASSVLETITVTLTSSSAFSVSGSVSGSLGTGTVGVAFTSSVANFTVVAGGTAWVNGDTIVFVMTPPWAQQRGVAGSEYIWKAPGNGNTDSIYVGAKTFTNATGDYFNWQLGGFTGFNSGLAFGLQPGSRVNSTTVFGQVLTLYNTSTPYWFVADGRHVKIVAFVANTVYVHACLGFINSYMSPGQFPYPLFVGGNLCFNSEPAVTSANWRWSYVGAQNSAYWHPSQDSTSNFSAASLRRWDGFWRGFDAASYSTSYGTVWPSTDRMTDLRTNLDGTYPLFPFVLTEDQGSGVTNIFGELPGVLCIPGIANASGNTFTINRTGYVVFQNVSKTGKTDYCALKLA